MGRSHGYRPTKAVRDEVMALRAELATVKSDKWVRASCIMQNITALLGKFGGPSGGQIEPRSCKYCRYFGHTKQHCQLRKRNYEAATARLLEQDRAHTAAVQAMPKAAPSTQGRTFDELGIPYMIAKDIGPIVAAPGDVCAGKWHY